MCWWLALSNGTEALEDNSADLLCARMIVSHAFYHSPSGKGVLTFPGNALPGLLLTIFTNFSFPNVSLMSTSTGSNIGEGVASELGVEDGQLFKS